MINLKDYINESILDDFEELSDKQHKETEHPWGMFWKNTTINKLNWGDCIKTLEHTISIGAKQTNDIPTVTKGRVYVAFWKPLSSMARKYIYIRYNKSDYDYFVKNYLFKGKKSIGLTKPVMSIIPTWPKITPHMSFGVSAQIPTSKSIETGYLLSKEQSQLAIDMINKFTDGEWASYVHSL